MPADAPKSTPPLIVISYSKEEEKWKDQLISMFPTDISFRLMLNRVEELPGRIDQETRQDLLDATILILLLSPTYLSSSWVTSDQGTLLLELESERRVKVLPVLLRYCSWQEIPYLRNRQLITSDGKPIAETSGREQARALSTLASVVSELAGLNAQPSAAKQGPTFSDASPHVAVDAIKELSWSSEVDKVLRLASSLGKLSRGPSIITSVSLLFALAENGKERSTTRRTPQFLWQELTRSGPQAYQSAFDSAFPQVVAEAREIKASGRLATTLTANAVGILERARSLSVRTLKLLPPAKGIAPPLSDGRIHTRHLLAALLTADSPTSVTDQVLGSIVDLTVFRRSFFDFVVRSAPLDAHEEWRSILQIEPEESRPSEQVNVRSNKSAEPEGNIEDIPISVVSAAYDDATAPEEPSLRGTIPTSVETPAPSQTTSVSSIAPGGETPADVHAPSQPQAETELLGGDETLDEAADETKLDLKPLLAGFATDYWSGRDLLNIEDDVNALASLVSAWSVEPPLSIGLFGDWGSGKSHFMRQMRQQVEKLSRKARKSSEKQNKIGYYKNIVQIEFNAWHYIEGNLWASLVDHIFANLRVTEKEKLSIVEARRDQLMDKLGVKKEIESKIKSKIEERKTQLQAKQREATDLATKAEQKKDVAATQLAGFRSEAEKQLDQLQIPLSFSEKDKSILKRIGIKPEEWTTAGDFRRHYDEVKGFGNRFSAQWKLFRTDRKVRRRFLLAAGLTLIPLAGLMLPKLSQTITMPARVLTVIGVVATFLTAALPTWKQFSAALSALEEHDAAVERERQKRIGQLQAEVTALAQKVIDAKTEAASIRREIEDLDHQIKTTTTSKILAEFIEDRAAAEDYRRHLGLLALIRRDFEKLRDLFDQQRTEEKAGKETHDKNRINRIVLYIDDLDRCPPQRVVEVLQAIHLLLAFPIFVVVVGVDARWVTRSLQESYEWLRLEDDEGKKNEETDDNEERSAEGATPHDYLEKIFQIPFWLRPMEEGVCKTFIQGLTEQIRYRAPEEVTQESNGDKKADAHIDPVRLELADSLSGNGHADKNDPAIEAGLKVDASTDEVVGSESSRANDLKKSDEPPAVDAVLESDVVTDDRARTDVAAGELNAGGLTEDQEQTTTVSGSESEHEVDSDDESIDLTPVGLTLGDHEIDYMTSLAKLVGRSPRAVKRFLNCYRLIKVSLPPAALKTFAQPAESYKYKAVMILLGIITGAPTVSLYVVEEIENWKSDDKTSTITDFSNKLEQNVDVARQPDWIRLKTFFDNRNGKDESAEMFQALRDITPRVSRYSFRIARAEAAGPKRVPAAAAGRKAKTTHQPTAS